MDMQSPLVLADGTQINPVDGSVQEEFVQVPSNIELQGNIVAARRRLGDLPAPSASMNTFSVVLAYTLFGLTDEDIATLTCLTSEQVGIIKTNDAFNKYKDELVDGVLRADQDKVRGYFTQLSMSAAERIGGQVAHPNPDVAFRASSDILDRAGHRPVDVVEHQHKMDGNMLTIEIIKRDNEEIPTIDVTPDEVSHDSF